MWRNALIALAAVALCTLGVGIIVYVGLARDRIVPTPTPIPTREATATVSPSPTPASQAAVSGVVRTYSPGALVIVLTPTEGNVQQIIVPENLVLTYSDGGRAAPSDITVGSALRAEGQLDALGRLIAARIVLLRQTHPTTPAPTRAPSPTAQPTATPPAVARAWTGEYYGNRSLSGAPILVRQDPVIDFQWKYAPPLPALAIGNYSVRWRGRWAFEQGGYRLYAYTADGVRLWVDGNPIIDAWRNQAATLTYADLYFQTGEHDLRVEYYSASSDAQVRVWWETRGPYPDWKGEYYASPDLSGKPALVRNDAEINYDWGQGSPGAGVPADRFSVRWTRTAQFEEGAYRFSARVDDGVRVWVDGPLIVDEWHQGAPTSYSGYIWLEGGPHTLRVEYFELGGGASAHVWWDRIERYDHWKGEYYANPDLMGRPAFVRDDETINYDWQNGSPGSGMPTDNYSVRWSRTVDFEARRYRFWAVADDGVRAFLDGAVLISAWHDGSALRHEAEVQLQGRHEVVVEYYERGDRAVIRAGWEPITSTPTATRTATATPAPPATLLAPTVTPASTASPTATATPVPPPPSPPPSPTMAPGRLGPGHR